MAQNRYNPGMARKLPPLVHQKLDELPAQPGCYLFLGQAGEVLYVGKATVLRSRVRSYFSPSQAYGTKSQHLVPEIQDISWWLTHSELEALTLENSLIKKHQPPFNVRLKDDKTYPYLKIHWQDPFPRISITRHMRQDGARYFGPYTNAKAVYQTLEGIRRIFPYLDCDRTITGQDERPCLYYHLQMCGGPCIGAQDAEDYRQGLRQMMRFLRGDTAETLQQLQERMEQAAANLDFERAATLRDRIRAVKRIVSQHQGVGTKPADEDYVATAFDPDSQQAVVQILFVRNGSLVGRDNFSLMGQDLEPRADAPSQRSRLVGAFLQQHYAKAAFVPPEIMVQAMPEEQALLEEFLAQQRGKKVKLAVPLRGAKRRVLELAYKNAREHLRVQQATWQIGERQQTQALTELQEILDLPRLPLRMECYDISTLQGTSTVGAMTVFVKGAARKSEYRKFRIQGKGSEGRPDDYASMREMLQRRFRRAVEAIRAPQSDPRKARSNWGLLPDLVIVDGGKGQLTQAVEVLKELDLFHMVSVIGLAKEQEEVFLPGNPQGLRLPPTCQGLFLLQRIRDEAHRFGIAYHRQLRSKAATKSVLDDVPGIGPARRKQLLTWCAGDLHRLQQASVAELAGIPGMNRKAARSLRDFFAAAATTRS